MPCRPLIAAACVAALAAGCVTTRKDPNPRFVQSGASPDGPPMTIAPPGATPPNVLSTTATCEGRLHEICGLLLQYYLDKRAFPPTLADALALDPAIDGTCPIAKRPYAYVPPSGAAIGQGHLLSAYAPGKNKAGKHWAILVRPKVGQNAPAAWVVEVTDDELARYLKYLQPAGPAPAAAAPRIEPTIR